MKKLILTLALVIMTLVASASSARYFTRPQAKRVVATLDAQNELMIYCGYEYELATYVIVNEVWAEPVNSKFYEIWLYGYDAYTGEEIYMPIDLACIWLYNSYGNRMYSAAQYLRFRSTVTTPNFYWTMPPYNSFVRHFHDPHFNHGYTYHYEIHRFGWRPPAPPHGGPWPYHPYYMRTPHTPAPVPTKPFTPGVNYPQTPDGHGYIGGSSRTTVGTRSTTFNNNGGSRSGNNMNNSGNPGTTNRNTSTNTGTTNRGTSTNTGTTSRGTSTNTGTTSRGTSTNTGTTDRGTSTNTGTTNRGTSTNTGTTNRGTSTNTGTTNRGTSTNTGTTNRGTSTNTGTTNRGTSTNTGTTSRGTSTNTSTNTPSRGTSTTTTSTPSRSTSTTTTTTTNTPSRGTSTTGSRNTSTNSGSRSNRN